MKKLILKTILLLMIVPFVIGCSNTDNKVDKSMEELNKKIEEIGKTIENSDGMQWASDNWDEIEAEYLVAKKKVKDEKEEMKEEWDESETLRKWDEIKRKVTEYKAEMEPDYIGKAYGAMGSEEPDTDLSFLTSANIADAYENYVHAVKQDFSKYDDKDAQAISDLWDRLNKRKDEVEPIPAKDNLKIAALKTEFVVVKTALNTKIGAESAVEDVKEKLNKKSEKQNLN